MMISVDGVRFGRLLWGVIVFGCILGGGQTVSMAEDSLRGPAFSDPRIVADMPAEWVKRRIEYDAAAKKEKPDIVITLDQQIFLMMR